MGAITDGVVVVVTLRGNTLSVFTLGGAESWITIIVDAGIGLGCMMKNISAKKCIAKVFSIPILFYSATGSGFSRAWMRYRYA